jgi:hypothetical protein
VHRSGSGGGHPHWDHLNQAGLHLLAARQGGDDPVIGGSENSSNGAHQLSWSLP